MNSVMDDNRLLTLANGERIRLQKHCAMLFEVFDLQYASPATISRCGMVYVDPKNLGYEPFWNRWLSAHSKRQTEFQGLTKLYEKYVPLCVDMIIEGVVEGRLGQRLKGVIPLTNLNLVTQLTNMLDALLGQEELEDPHELEALFLQASFLSFTIAVILVVVIHTYIHTYMYKHHHHHHHQSSVV